MEILVIFGLVFVVAIIVAVVNAKDLLKDAAEMRTRVSAKFKCDDLYVSSNRPIKCVGVSFQDRTVILGIKASVFAYEFSKLTAVEMVENGATVTHTNRGSQLLGAAVGGAVFGGLGAVVGGLSGSSRSQSRIKSLYLKLTIDDPVLPVWLICFFNDSTKNGSDPDGLLVRTERLKRERMHAHLLNAMRQSQVAHAMPVPTIFSADRLRQFWDLKQAGILTKDEYEHQKVRLLDMPNHDSGPTLVAPDTEELQKLWNLKLAGILTDEEFTDQKARVLGGLPAPNVSDVAGTPVGQPQ